MLISYTCVTDGGVSYSICSSRSNSPLVEENKMFSILKEHNSSGEVDDS